MIQDIFTILHWWLILLGVGIIFLPLSNRLFSRFWDKGYIFSKVMGILLVSYVVWLLGSLKILSFSRETIILVTAGWAIINLYLVRNTKHETRNTKIIKIFIAEELLFLACLTIWSLVRGFQPNIQGLEKFMDFGFVNAVLRTKYFPPTDMWFAGSGINYYYFGHFVAALLTKLSNINSAITYNLQIATLFALAFTTTFSLTSNLLYRLKTSSFKLQASSLIAGGLLAAFLLTLGANLHPAYYNLKMKVFKKPYCNGSLNYWYPDATRFIGYCPEVEDKTIHEFPAYSFVVSDLHGHVSDIPFVMLFLALIFTVVISANQSLSLLKSFLISLILGVMYITNAWDLPIYLMALGLVFLWLNYQKHGFNFKTISHAVFHISCSLLLAILFILPFQLRFESIAKGIGFVNARSLPHQLLILWGTPWFFGISFVVFLIKKEFLVQKFADFLNVKISLKKKPHIPHTTYHIPHTDFFVLILLAVSTILIFIPEVIYLKDIYIASYHRANTIFKLTYQAFMMYSISIGYIIVRVLPSLKKGFLKLLLVTGYWSLVAGLMVYPFFSLKPYYGLKTYRGLYGLNFIKQLYPDNYQVILWLNDNVSGQPVILEAAGDSYTDYNQISMATGLPTIEGWLVHEWLWRGGYDEPGKRAGEVQQIYEGDQITAKPLLTKYDVNYVIVGKLEREKYPKINEDKFNYLGKVVFKSGKTKVFKILAN